MPLRPTLALGATFDLLIYLVKFHYPVVTILFPQFVMARNRISLGSHVVFGVVLACSYIAFARRRARRGKTGGRTEPAGGAAVLAGSPRAYIAYCLIASDQNGTVCLPAQSERKDNVRFRGNACEKAFRHQLLHWKAVHISQVVPANMQQVVMGETTSTQTQFDRPCRGSLSLAGTFLLLFVHGAAMSQPLELERITVTAPRIETPLSRVPGAIGVLTEETIQNARQGLGLDESLVGIPGVFMRNRYNFAQDLRVAIRGFGARAPFGIRGVRILVDGIPATLPDGQTSVDAIDLDTISRMEVMRGSSSSLYGNASGGVIDITTHAPSAVPFAGVASSSGSHGFGKHSVRAGGEFGDLGFSLSQSELDYDGFRELSRTKSTKFNSRFEYALSKDSDVTLVARSVNESLAQDPGALTAREVSEDRRQASPANLRFNAGEELKEQQLGVVYRGHLGDNREIQMRGYSIIRDFQNRLPFTRGGRVEFDRRFDGIGALYTADTRLLGRDNRWLIGIDIDRQRDDRQRYDNVSGVTGDLVLDQLESVTSNGMFAQTEVSLTDRLSLTAGVRHDRIRFEVDDRFGNDDIDDSGRRTLSELSPKLGLTYHAGPALTTYASLSSSFETPTTTEFARCNGRGFVEELDAQRSMSYEIGATGQLTSRIDFGAALYYTKGRDEIVARGCPEQPGRDFFVNAGRTTRQGVELSFDAEISPRWSAAIAYTYSGFVFDRFQSGGDTFDGNDIPGTPHHTLYTELKYQHEGGWFAALDALFTDDLFADNANTVSDQESMVVDTRIGYTKDIGKWKAGAYIGVNNLLDERYNSNVRINAFGGRHFEPAPGRNSYGGITLRYEFSDRGRR